MLPIVTLSHLILERSEGSGSLGSEMRGFAQHDKAVPACHTLVGVLAVALAMAVRHEPYINAYRASPLSLR